MLKVFGEKLKFWTFTLKVAACTVVRPARSPIKIKTRQSFIIFSFVMRISRVLFRDHGHEIVLRTKMEWAL